MSILNARALDEFLLFLALEKITSRNLVVERMLLDFLRQEWNTENSTWRSHFYSIATFLNKVNYPENSTLKNSWKKLSDEILKSFDLPAPKRGNIRR